jgi:hypothetical protein
MKAVKSPLEFKIPILLLSHTHSTIAAKALLDCGSGATFIDERFVQEHGI